MKSTYLLSAVAVSALLISSPSMAYEKNKQMTKTDNGRVIDRTYQTKKGEVKSHNEVTKTGNGGWNGTRTVEQQRNADGTVTHTVTDPNGQVHTNTAPDGKMARHDFRQERRAQWRDNRVQGGQVGNQ